MVQMDVYYTARIKGTGSSSGGRKRSTRVEVCPE